MCRARARAHTHKRTHRSWRSNRGARQGYAHMTAYGADSERKGLDIGRCDAHLGSRDSTCERRREFSRGTVLYSPRRPSHSCAPCGATWRHCAERDPAFGLHVRQSRAAPPSKHACARPKRGGRPAQERGQTCQSSSAHSLGFRGYLRVLERPAAEGIETAICGHGCNGVPMSGLEHRGSPHPSTPGKRESKRVTKRVPSGRASLAPPSLRAPPGDASLPRPCLHLGLERLLCAAAHGS